MWLQFFFKTPQDPKPFFIIIWLIFMETINGIYKYLYIRYKERKKKVVRAFGTYKKKVFDMPWDQQCIQQRVNKNQTQITLSQITYAIRVELENTKEKDKTKIKNLNSPERKSRERVYLINNANNKEQSRIKHKSHCQI